MNKTILLKNLITAFAAQGVAFICSAVMSLLVPRLLGVAEYGYYQLFIFYTSYVSFFAFGLNDGIYLEHGGEDRINIDKSLILSEFLVGLGVQLAIAVVLSSYAFLGDFEPERQFVLIASSLFMLISNATYYFGYVFQSMNETRLFSYGSMLDRVVFLVPLLVCLIFTISDFRVYVVCFVLARVAALVFSLWNARDFLASPLMKAGESVRRAVRSMKIGIVLTVANVSFMLIMGFARSLVDTLWGIEAFGKLSFSLSLVNFAVTFISQASMVLFPALRQSDEEALARCYRVLRSGLSSILPLSYLLYFPLRIFAGIWLPQYEESLYYLIYLMPICVFSVQNNVLYCTYYKVRNEPRKLLWVNVRALGISAAGVCFAAFFIGDVIAVVVFAVCGIASCLVMSDRYLSQQYSCQGDFTVFMSLAVTGGFVAANALLGFSKAFIVTLILLAIYAALRRRELSDILSRALGLIRSRRR